MYLNPVIRKSVNPNLRRHHTMYLNKWVPSQYHRNNKCIVNENTFFIYLNRVKNKSEVQVIQPLKRKKVDQVWLNDIWSREDFARSIKIKKSRSRDFKKKKNPNILSCLVYYNMVMSTIREFFIVDDILNDIMLVFLIAIFHISRSEGWLLVPVPVIDVEVGKKELHFNLGSLWWI